MHFAAPWFALALIGVPPMLWLAARAWRLRAAALRRIAGPQAMQTAASWGRLALFVVAAIALIIAAMRPQWGETDADVSRRGRDIVVLLDVSLSMMAADAQANGRARSRFGRAQTGLLELVNRLESEGGHRIALVTFAGRTTLLSPLSGDYDLFRARLAVADPRKAPGPGTEIGAALERTLRGFISDQPAFTDIVVLSDGEDFGSQIVEAAGAAALAGVRVHAFAIGDASRAVVLTVPGNDGRRVTIEYQGRPVQTRMQPQTLRALVDGAKESAGQFVIAGTGEVELAAWYDTAIASAPRRLLSETAEAQPAERYAVFVLVALLALLIDAGLAYAARRPASAPRNRAAVQPALAVLFGCVALGLLGFSLLEPLSRELSDGNSAFGDGRFEVARAHYERAVELDPESRIAHFNLGAARYRAQELEGALDAFRATHEQLATDTDTPLAARAHYNEGVVHYQRAIARLDSGREAAGASGDAADADDEAAGAVRHAIQAFRDALAREPGHGDARFNLSLALMLLFELESRHEAMITDASGNDPNGSQDAPGGDDKDGAQERAEGEQPDGQGAGDSGQDMSGMAGKPAESGGAKNAMPGDGQGGQRTQQLSRSDVEQLLSKVRLDTASALADASRHHLNRLKAGANGPFW